MPAIGINRGLSDPLNVVPTVSNFDEIVTGVSGILDWHDARPRYLVLDGSGNVATWLPRGVGSNFTQSTEGKRPSVEANQFGEHPALGFVEGTPNWMEWSGAFPTSSDFTKIVLYSANSVPGTGQRHLLSSNTTERHNMFQNSTGNLIGVVGNTDTVQAFQSYETQEWVLAVHSFDRDTGTAKMSINGTSPSEATTAGAVTDQTSLYLGSANGDTSPFDGMIGSVMIFNRDMLAEAAEDDLALIYSFYRQVYGLTI